MFEDVQITIVLNACAGLAYLALAALILSQAKRSRTGILLAGACLLTSLWAAGSAAGAAYDNPHLGGSLDLLRAAAWYGFILHLYRRSVPAGHPIARFFVGILVLIASATVAVILFGAPAMAGRTSLASAATGLTLLCALCQLLVLENLYRNGSDALRWTLQLTCVALGGLAIYDVVLCANALLLHRWSPALVGGRPVVACIVVPLLALAAARNHRWAVNIHVSRSAVFYSATLVVSGVFLLALAAAGEAVRAFAPDSDAPWASIAEVTLVFAGLIVIATLLASQSSRSWLRALLVDHFFTHRYDYRREWLRCIDTLSNHGQDSLLETRVIRSIAQLVDSPAGVLLQREPGDAAMHWAGSWNVPSSSLRLPANHRLAHRLAESGSVVCVLDAPDIAVCLTGQDNAANPRPAWLAVPLRQGGRLDGCILVAPPRSPFALDAEVTDLLRTVASEVAIHLAEQRAARTLAETRDLREYAERFAFVAHDIKNVSSQLSLLLSNAEIHIANPAFQRDMLTTVQASVRKIGALIQRLQHQEATAPPGAMLEPLERIERLADHFRASRGTVIDLHHDHGAGIAAMEPAAFDMVVTHLMDNAVESSDEDRPIAIDLRHEADSIIIEIVDQGRGMTPEFIRDELFQPFHTSKSNGSGIGAFQARELLRMAGGSLTVASRPGQGTSMRLKLPATCSIASGMNAVTRAA